MIITNLKKRGQLLAFICALIPNLTWAQTSYSYRDIAAFDQAFPEIKSKIANKEQITSGIPTMYITVTNYTKNTGETVNGIEISKTTSMPESFTSDDEFNKYLFKRRGNTGDDDFAPYMNASIKIVDNSTGEENLAMEDDGLTIKARGNMTSSLYKRPYRLKFGKDVKDEAGNVVESHKHDLINGDSNSKAKKMRNWVLLSNDNDRSLIRNAVTYHIGKYLGLAFCPRYRFVELVVNGSYRGVYQITDQVEQGSVRVPVKEDTGWLLELNSNTQQLETPYVTPQNNTGANIKNPDADDLTDEETQNLIDEVKSFLDLVKTSYDQYGSFTNPNKGYRAYVDVESLINFYIALELTGDYDGMMSMYTYKDNLEGLDQKLHFGPLWDKDLAYGNYGSVAKVCDYANQSQIQEWFKVLWTDPELMVQVNNRYDAVKEGLKTELATEINSMSTLLAEAASNNFNKWGINGQQKGSWTTIGNLDSYEAYVNELKSWLLSGSSNRMNWMDETITSALTTINNNKITYTYDTSAYLYSVSLYNEKNKLADVTVTNRTFEANKWISVCFPFSISAEKLAAAFGSGYELKEFTGVSPDGTLQFTTPNDNAIVSERPYLLKFSGDDKTTLSFNGVTISGNPSNDSNSFNNGAVVTFEETSFSGNLFQYGIGTNNTYLIDGDAKLVKNTNNDLSGSYAFVTTTTETPKINIISSEVTDLTLNMTEGDNSEKNDMIGGTYNITLQNRGYLYADGWCTICLPFTITKKEFEEAIGYDTKLRELSNIKGTSFDFGKVDNKTLEAGKPYLIMIENDDHTITFNLGEKKFEAVKLEAVVGTGVSPKEGYAFVGTLSATDLKTDGTELFLGGTGDILMKPSATDYTLSGGKAYFQVPSKDAGTNAKINIDGVETSAIEALHSDFKSINDNKVYNLNGQMIGTNLDNLPRGIYILNGKKIIK